RVAVADILGSGFPDIITVPGPGMLPEIKVFRGQDGALLRDFYAVFGFNPQFTGGANVAAGAILGNGLADIVVGAAAGGLPEVLAYTGDGNKLRDFYAYDPAFGGGVTVAVGDVNGDGIGDIITGTAHGAPHVKVFNGANGDIALLFSFFAYDPAYIG